MWTKQYKDTAVIYTWPFMQQLMNLSSFEESTEHQNNYGFTLTNKRCRRVLFLLLLALLPMSQLQQNGTVDILLYSTTHYKSKSIVCRSYAPLTLRKTHNSESCIERIGQWERQSCVVDASVALMMSVVRWHVYRIQIPKKADGRTDGVCLHGFLFLCFTLYSVVEQIES